MRNQPTCACLDRAIVGRRLDRGRAVEPLAVRHALAALQRRGVTELRAVAHRGVDVDHAGFADERVAADLDRADVNEVRLRAITENDRILAQDGVVADRYHVGANRGELRIDDDVAADPRAHQAQIGAVDRRADEHHHRRGPHQGLHRPEAEIGETPDRDRLPRLEAADQYPLGDDRDRGQGDERSRRIHDAARVNLEHAVRSSGPLIADIEHQNAEQRISRVERGLQGAAGVVGEIGRNVERLAFRRNKTTQRCLEVRGKKRDGRVEIDVAHRHPGHAGVLADDRAETRHQQRVRAHVVEEMIFDRYVLHPEDSSRVRTQGSVRYRFSAGRSPCRPRSAAPVASAASCGRPCC